MEVSPVEKRNAIAGKCVNLTNPLTLDASCSSTATADRSHDF